MTTPVYDPPNNEPRIACSGYVPRVRLDIVYVPHLKDATVGPEVTFVTIEAARAEQQRIALAIADRVHGPELARLREVEGTYLDLVKRLRAAMIDELRIVSTNASGDIDCGFHDAKNVEVFDEASLAVGLPISNEDGVPSELLPPTVSFKPTLTVADDGCYVVKWGRGADERERYGILGNAIEDFGERYVAWKAGQR